MNRRIVLHVLALGLVLALAPAHPSRAGAAAAPPQASLLFGSWNIQWLGSPNQRSGAAEGKLQTAADIAEYIRASGVSVLALNEITETTRNERGPRNWILSAAFNVIRSQTGETWQYVLFPKANNVRTQLCGLAWNTAKSRLAPNALWRIPMSYAGSQGRLWDRPPHAVKLSFGPGRTDAVFIAVHQKSNVGNGDHVLTRKEESQRLAGRLGQVRARFHDEDIVILGDTNVLNAGEPAVTAITGAGFVDLNADDRDTSRHNNAPFDRIYVPAGQPEFQNARQWIFAEQFMQPRGLNEHDFWLRFSDHYMVVSQLRLGPDDDQ